MRRTCSVRSAAAPEDVWRLMARPAQWSTWAPHIRGAWGLGDPEVEAGRRGAARLLGTVPVPARIDAVDPGRSWTWTVGPVRLEHRVDPADLQATGDGGGSARSVVTMTVEAPAPIAAAYAPVVAFFTHRLARVAQR